MPQKHAQMQSMTMSAQTLQGAGAAEPEPNLTPLQCLRSLDFWLLVFACIIGTPALQPVQKLMHIF